VTGIIVDLFAGGGVERELAWMRDANLCPLV